MARTEIQAMIFTSRKPITYAGRAAENIS